VSLVIFKWRSILVSVILISKKKKDWPRPVSVGYKLRHAKSSNKSSDSNSA
jgi:hypothetical protein